MRGSDVAPSIVDVVGAAHLDVYVRPPCDTRKAYLTRHGLDPARRTIAKATPGICQCSRTVSTKGSICFRRSSNILASSLRLGVAS